MRAVEALFLYKSDVIFCPKKSFLIVNCQIYPKF